MQGSFTLSARVVSGNMEARERGYARSRAGIWALTRGNMDKKTSNRKKVGRDTHGIGRCVDKTFCIDSLDADDAENTDS